LFPEEAVCFGTLRGSALGGLGGCRFEVKVRGLELGILLAAEEVPWDGKDTFDGWRRSLGSLRWFGDGDVAWTFGAQSTEGGGGGEVALRLQLLGARATY